MKISKIIFLVPMEKILISNKLFFFENIFFSIGKENYFLSNGKSFTFKENFFL